MKILLILLLLCLVSIFIPHNDKPYNFSWHFRVLGAITYIYFLGYMLYLLGYFILWTFNKLLTI